MIRVALVCLLLAGCATTTPVPVVHTVCAVTVKPYTAAEQNKVADEMAAAPANAVWPLWITDYGKERAALRACAKAAR